jgi:hypothetical protein
VGSVGKRVARAVELSFSKNETRFSIGQTVACLDAAPSRSERFRVVDINRSD